MPIATGRLRLVAAVRKKCFEVDLICWQLISQRLLGSPLKPGKRLQYLPSSIARISCQNHPVPMDIAAGKPPGIESVKQIYKSFLTCFSVSNMFFVI